MSHSALYEFMYIFLVRRAMLWILCVMNSEVILTSIFSKIFGTENLGDCEADMVDGVSLRPFLSLVL